METEPEQVSQDLVLHHAFSRCPSVYLSISHLPVVSCSSQSPSTRPGPEQWLMESLVDKVTGEQETTAWTVEVREVPVERPPKPTPWPGSGAAVSTQSSGYQGRTQTVE